MTASDEVVMVNFIFSDYHQIDHDTSLSCRTLVHNLSHNKFKFINASFKGMLRGYKRRYAASRG